MSSDVSNVICPADVKDSYFLRCANVYIAPVRAGPTIGKRALDAIFTRKVIVTTRLLPLLRRRCGLCGNGGMAHASRSIAEARGLISIFKDNAAVASIATHKLRNDISVLEGFGGNIAVLTGPDGKVLIDGGIGA